MLTPTCHVPRYLTGLQASQHQLSDMLEQQAAREAKAAAEHQAAAAAAIQQAEQALATRQAQLEAAAKEVNSRIVDMTAPVQAERELVAERCSALQVCSSLE